MLMPSPVKLVEMDMMAKTMPKTAMMKVPVDKVQQQQDFTRTILTRKNV
jgi:hypothetical protein